MTIQITIQIEILPIKVWKPIKWVSTKNYIIEDFDEDGTPSYTEGGGRKVTEEERMMVVEFLSRKNPYRVEQTPPMEVQPKRTRNPFKMGRIH